MDGNNFIIPANEYRRLVKESVELEMVKNYIAAEHGYASTDRMAVIFGWKDPEEADAES